MALCEESYLHLIKMAPDLKRLHGTFQSSLVEHIVTSVQFRYHQGRVDGQAAVNGQAALGDRAQLHDTGVENR